MRAAKNNRLWEPTDSDRRAARLDPRQLPFRFDGDSAVGSELEQTVCRYEGIGVMKQEYPGANQNTATL